ncbi:expressed unknown protein [Seminavis robusta]|uniref:DUF6824 domain-containing protein n=1 Tax=Seminavis robusta TaxID=568900 RepID=A0A9N8DW06_9STRA|nr:expressed unknown protein [Seminavis robusta]|eukprot:Sro336_g120300.1 n/a (282) ;mRNA; r:25758-26685
MNTDSYPMNNIVAPGEHDCLSGRGGHTIHWSGNIKFRNLVEQHRERYHAASRVQKGKVVAEVVQIWRKMTPPGRFLTLTDPKLGDASAWHDIGDKSAQKKTAKRLREGHTSTMTTAPSASATVVSSDDFSSDSSISSHSTSSNKRSIRRVSNESMERAAKRVRLEMNAEEEQVPMMNLLLEDQVTEDDFELLDVSTEDFKNLDSLFEETTNDNNNNNNTVKQQPVVSKANSMDNFQDSLFSLTLPTAAAKVNSASFGSPLLHEIAVSIPSAADLTEYSLFD